MQDQKAERRSASVDLCVCGHKNRTTRVQPRRGGFSAKKSFPSVCLEKGLQALEAV
jgi:hypothetical protein